MAKHSRYDGELPDFIIVQKNKYDYIGVKCEFVKEKGDYAYYLKADGTCSTLEWFNVNDFDEKLNKSIFIDRKSFANYILENIEKLKNRCEDYIKSQEDFNF